jgi:hypothetical protein
VTGNQGVRCQASGVLGAAFVGVLDLCERASEKA